MLFVLRDLVRSKTMIFVMVFIIGVSYIGGLNNKTLNEKVENNINMVEEVN